MSMNPYDILGVAKEATDADIKKAYHKLVLRYHPDKNPGDKSAEEKFKEVNNAFDILKDPQKRAAYDRFGEAAFSGGNGASAGMGGNPFGNGAFHFDMGGGAGMDDILREAMRGFGFGGFESSQSHSNKMAGRDLLDEVTISLKEAFFGTVHTVKFATNVKCEKCGGFGTSNGRSAPVCQHCHGTGYVHSRQGFFAMQTPCSDCHGTGYKIDKKCSDCEGSGVARKQRTLEVKIPAGVMDESRLRLAGQGESGMNGAPAGDFYIDIHVLPDRKFKRKGQDLICSCEVPFTILALGGDIDIETIDEKKLSIKIPAGTQVGESLRIRGHGMPNGHSGFGDLYIEINIVIPTKLTEKQKKILEEFADTKPKKGWF